MNILYMLRNQPDDLIKEMISQHANENEVTIVMIQQAAEALTLPDLPGSVLILDESRSDKNGPGESDTAPSKRIDYTGLLKLIFENDRVLCI